MAVYPAITEQAAIEYVAAYFAGDESISGAWAMPWAFDRAERDAAAPDVVRVYGRVTYEHGAVQDVCFDVWNETLMGGRPYGEW